MNRKHSGVYVYLTGLFLPIRIIGTGMVYVCRFASTLTIGSKSAFSDK